MAQLTPPKILVVGSLVMDLIVSTPRFPAKGETVIGSGFQTASGGKGANQAIQAARLGASVTMVRKIGEDDFGVRMRDSLSDSGVDNTHLMVQGGVPSGVGNVQLETGGGKASNRIIVVPGTNMTITPDEVGDQPDSCRIRSGKRHPGDAEFRALRAASPFAAGETELHISQ